MFTSSVVLDNDKMLVVLDQDQDKITYNSPLLITNSASKVPIHNPVNVIEHLILHIVCSFQNLHDWCSRFVPDKCVRLVDVEHLNAHNSKDDIIITNETIYESRKV